MTALKFQEKFETDLEKTVGKELEEVFHHVKERR
jgi:hypothetical protein